MECSYKDSSGRFLTEAARVNLKKDENVPKNHNPINNRHCLGIDPDGGRMGGGEIMDLITEEQEKRQEVFDIFLEVVCCGCLFILLFFFWLLAVAYGI